MKYANSGFGSTDYSLWDDAQESDAQEEHLEEPEQLEEHTEEIPRAPSPAGLKHLLRMGTCNPCLGRLGGKRSFQQTDEASGQQIRDMISEEINASSTFETKFHCVHSVKISSKRLNFLPMLSRILFKAMISKNCRLVHAFRKIKSSMKKAFVSNTLLEVQTH